MRTADILLKSDKLEAFKKWIQANGGVILPNTNQYELIRFKGLSVGIVYISGKTSGTYTDSAIDSWRRGKSWDNAPISTKRKSGGYKKYHNGLVERDGRICMICGDLLMHDITVEHLQPLTAGGKNSIENMVLAHEKCNQKLSNLSLVEKLKLIVEARIKTYKIREQYSSVGPDDVPF